VAIQYLAAWLGGNGCVPIDHLMEDAATAEISRAQIWHWVCHETGILEDGRNITYALFKEMLDEELSRVLDLPGTSAAVAGHLPEAAALLEDLTSRDDLAGFLTLEAYAKLD
jgi:malate synthase